MTLDEALAECLNMADDLSRAVEFASAKRRAEALRLLIAVVTRDHKDDPAR